MTDFDEEPGRVLIALIEDSPWPEAGQTCDGYDDEPARHAARWAIWTNHDTGDGYRTACTDHLGAWAESVTARLWDIR